ncbi:hypothetical protein MMPV_004236 [Pyropia vietnamensis]
MAPSAAAAAAAAVAAAGACARCALRALGARQWQAFAGDEAAAQAAVAALVRGGGRSGGRATGTGHGGGGNGDVSSVTTTAAASAALAASSSAAATVTATAAAAGAEATPAIAATGAAAAVPSIVWAPSEPPCPCCLGILQDTSLAAAVDAVQRLPLARGTPADVAARLAGVRLDSDGANATAPAVSAPPPPPVAAGAAADADGGHGDADGPAPPPPSPPPRQPLLHVGTYRLSVTVPPAADIMRARSFEAAARTAAGDSWAAPVRGLLPLREAVKWALGGRLDAATGLIYAPGGGGEVGVSWAHPAADDAAAATLGGCGVPERRKRRWRPGGGGRDKQSEGEASAAATVAAGDVGAPAESISSPPPGAPRVSAGAMARVVAAMDAATFASRVPFPPPSPSVPCTITAVACLPPLSLAGHYTKASRRVSQTAWYDGPTRMAASATSVEELLLPPALTAALTAPPGPGGSAGVTFSAGGREDVDVRMLGGGRPFVVRVASPSIHADLLAASVEVGSKETGYTALERLMRASGRGLVDVHGLGGLPPSVVATGRCGGGEAGETWVKDAEVNKRKLYRCVVWFDRPVDEALLRARLTWGDDDMAAGARDSAPAVVTAASAVATEEGAPVGGRSPVVAADIKRRRLDDSGGVAATDSSASSAGTNGAGDARATRGGDSPHSLPPYRFSDGTSPWDPATGALLLRQSTPLRVLHRRTSATRIRAVTACRVVRAVTPRVAVIDVTTAAGTYVKEFVHGDWGRTVPSVGGLLGVAADILQLDVRGISMRE